MGVKVGLGLVAQALAWGVYHSKLLQDKGIIDKDIIRSKVLQDKGIVRN